VARRTPRRTGKAPAPDPAAKRQVMAAIHEDQPVAQSGAPLSRAKGAMIMLHGRGATAENILSLADVFAQPDFAYFAPQAAGRTWYPYSFLTKLEQNEPYLSSALATVGNLLDRLAAENFPASRVALLGFSQGACLSLEYAARFPQKYGAVLALTGGLIGPDVSASNYKGSLEGTPIFIGCSDIDAHVPLARVKDSTKILTGMGAAVTERIYPGMGHSINDDEIANIRAAMVKMMNGV
jgi:phospholipase/carboxylesterase